MYQYLKETKLIDFNHPAIFKLVKSKGWHSLNEKEKIKQI